MENYIKPKPIGLLFAMSCYITHGIISIVPIALINLFLCKVRQIVISLVC